MSAGAVALGEGRGQAASGEEVRLPMFRVIRNWLSARHNAKHNAQLVAQRLHVIWAAEAKPVQFKKAA